MPNLLRSRRTRTM
ncbi:hypothetical protein QTP70_032514 [Hemibagrus guttatus]|uniref:Uncharacterized protein n=1 Tax=Hemibagrus guttatus TaxID=175788 RepID=A0AAE0UZI9_9TELE|nr:hypothetical protein QTP70_032514 [Hemibagrus guttatus]